KATRMRELQQSSSEAHVFKKTIDAFARHKHCSLEGKASTSLCVNGHILFRSTNMAKDDRDILELLEAELDFIEKGGYGRSVRTPWKPTSSFRDSLTCVNYALPEKAHPCSECHLIDFVPREQQSEELPCHAIPLTAAGDTVESLEGNEGKLQEALKDWMR